MNQSLPQRQFFNRPSSHASGSLGLNGNPHQTDESAVFSSNPKSKGQDFQKLFSDNFQRYSVDVEAGLASGRYSSANADFLSPLKSIPIGIDALGPVVKQQTQRILSGTKFFVDMISTQYTDGLQVVAVNNLGRHDIELVFRKSRDSSLWITTLENKIDVTLPLEYSESELTFSIVALWLIKMQFAKIAISNRQMSPSGSRRNFTSSKTNESEQDIDYCPPSNGVHRVSHDLLCTIPDLLAPLLLAEGISIPLDGKFYVWAPTLGSQLVDVIDCCLSHDIALWCSNSRDSFIERSARSADFDVVACILSKMYDAFTRGNVIDDIVNTLYFSRYSYLFVLLALGAQFSNLGHKDPLLNLDHRNDGSCLCGGTNPTVACYEPCRDLCKEFGKPQKCGKCYWGCDYDVDTGSPIGLVYKSAPNGLPCCPETAYGCLKPLPLEKQCPKREKGCYDCSYICKKCSPYHYKHCPNPGVGKIVLDFAENKPCCKGTPKPYGPYFCATDPSKDTKPFA